MVSSNYLNSINKLYCCGTILSWQHLTLFREKIKLLIVQTSIIKQITSPENNSSMIIAIYATLLILYLSILLSSIKENRKLYINYLLMVVTFMLSGFPLIQTGLMGVMVFSASVMIIRGLKKPVKIEWALIALSAILHGIASYLIMAEW